MLPYGARYRWVTVRVPVTVPVPVLWVSSSSPEVQGLGRGIGGQQQGVACVVDVGGVMRGPAGRGGRDLRQLPGVVMPVMSPVLP